MDRNDYRDGDDTDQPDAYWRRRAITLAVGLGLIGLLAWAFTGGGGKPATPAAARSTSGLSSAAAFSSEQASAAGTGPASAGTKAGQAGKGDATVPGLPSPSADASPSPGGSAAKKTKTANLPGAGSTAKASADPTGDGVEADGSCAPGSIVLTLYGGEYEYGRGQDPSFGVDVVSTASRNCSADLGAKHLDLVVMSSGRIIWDSSDCAKDDGSRATELTRGVPVQQELTWNRSITLPGCVTLADSARAGTYEVQARDGSVGSPIRTIKIVR